MLATMPVAFHFVVRFAGDGAGNDTALQEVSGIGSEMDTTDFAEGGENRFVHSLSVGVKHTALSLKRGVADLDSSLVKWCRATLEGGFGQTIENRDFTVALIDATGKPLRKWWFSNAFPQSWTIDPFEADEGSVAIEKIVLGYAMMARKL